MIRDKVECDHSIWAPLESVMLKRVHSSHSYNEQTGGCLGRREGAFCYPHAQLRREIQDWSVSSVVSLLFLGSFWFIWGFSLAIAPCCEDALQGDNKVRKRTGDEDLVCVCWSVSLTLYFFFLLSSPASQRPRKPVLLAPPYLWHSDTVADFTVCLVASERWGILLTIGEVTSRLEGMN